MQTIFEYATLPNGSDRLKHTYKVLTHARNYLAAIQIVPNQPLQSNE